MISDPITFLHEVGPTDLTPSLLTQAGRRLRDTIGVWAAGRQTDLLRIIHAHAARHFGGQQAWLAFDGRAASPAGAALAGGMSIDSLDAHDGHKLTKGHVGCGTIPALIALAVATGEPVDGPALLAALVVGYEIGTRAGIALHASATDYHTSGAWVALAAAALGARALGLSRYQTAEALGIAEYHGPRSPMMRCIAHPTMLKDGSGWGAMAGVSAAYLACDGFTGAPADLLQVPDIWDDLGQRWRIGEQYDKPHPVCRWAQPAVAAVLAIGSAHRIEAANIQAVRVESFAEAIALHTVAPTTTEQAQYSLPFTVAAALLRGRLGVNEILGASLSDPAILDLSARVEGVVDPALSAAFPARRIARVQVTLNDGTVLQSPETEAPGDPETPLDDPTLRAKAEDLAGPVIGADRWAAISAAIDALAEGAPAEALLGQLRLQPGAATSEAYSGAYRSGR